MLEREVHRSEMEPTFGTVSLYCSRGTTLTSACTFQTSGHCCVSVVLFYLCGFGKRVQSDQVDLQCALLLHGQGECQVTEGVESHRDFGANRTDQRGLEEAVKDVHDDGVIPFDVVLPSFLSHHLVAWGQRHKMGCVTLGLSQLHTCVTKTEEISLCLACHWHLSVGCKASFWCGSSPRGGRLEGRPGVRESPVAGSPRTVGQSGPPGSGDERRRRKRENRLKRINLKKLI